MPINCPKCNSQNRADASFCDACGASLSVAANEESIAPETETGNQQKPNLVGLIGVPVILLIAWYFMFGPNGNSNTQATNGSSGQMANPHGEQSANPHGGMDTGEAGSDAQMSQMMGGIDEAKAKLDENPLDIESLKTLYQTFSIIGRQDQIRPRLDAAVAALIEKQDEMTPSEVSNTLEGIVYSALSGNDIEGVEFALETIGEATPDNIGIMALHGNIYFDLGRIDEAITAYDSYLEIADAETEGDQYWNVLTDRATMVLQFGLSNSDDEMIRTARQK